jgi:hypothetical protein
MYPSAPYCEEPYTHTPIEYPQTLSPNNTPSEEGTMITYDNPDYDRIVDLPKEARDKAYFVRYLKALDKLQAVDKPNIKKFFVRLNESLHNIEQKKASQWATNVNDLIERIKRGIANQKQVEWLERYLSTVHDDIDDLYEPLFGPPS